MADTLIWDATGVEIHQVVVGPVDNNVLVLDAVDEGVVDLGLIYGLHLEPDNTLTIDMTLTSAACPLTDVIEDQTNTALEGLVNGFAINWVWMPPWGLEKITEDGREQLRALGFNV